MVVEVKGAVQEDVQALPYIHQCLIAEEGLLTSVELGLLGGDGFGYSHGLPPALLQL